MLELFCKNKLQQLNIFAECFIVNIWHGPKYTYDSKRVEITLLQIQIQTSFNPCNTTGLFLHSLKVLGDLWFSDVFRGN